MENKFIEDYILDIFNLSETTYNLQKADIDIYPDILQKTKETAASIVANIYKDNKIYPYRIAPSIEGGIAICYAGNKYKVKHKTMYKCVFMEIYNDDSNIIVLEKYVKSMFRRKFQENIIKIKSFETDKYDNTEIDKYIKLMLVQ
jgi:hypothetical protein